MESDANLTLADSDSHIEVIKAAESYMKEKILEPKIYLQICNITFQKKSTLNKTKVCFCYS